MDQAQLKQHAIDLIHSWFSILEGKGIFYVLPDDLETLSNIELRAIVKEMRDLGRTPTE